jgi:manganese/zinc/iron transport system permease protein
MEGDKPMIWDILAGVSQWSALDTWIAVTGALAAMACALPGCFLVLRRQSMMGDALSHTSLLGVVSGFLLAHGLKSSGWISAEFYAATQHAVMFAGAMAIGVLAALLTEWIQKLGRVEASAALGVVFTILFALGLILIRVAADSVHIDPDCVLYGTVETSYVGAGAPRAAVVNGLVLLVNLALATVFFKELRVSAFDPALATTLGIHAGWMHYGLMAITAATVVAAFESVGVILVIAMLIAPGATAHLLTDRLGWMLAISLVVAALSALLGHALAIGLPSPLFSRLGFDTVRDASTAGMMAVASGLLFVAAVLLAPRHGLLSKSLAQARLGLKIAGEDLLGLLYRLEEQHFEGNTRFAPRVIEQSLGIGRMLTWLAVRRLAWQGNIAASRQGYQLTASGRQTARLLVRSHRLWESYLSKHFDLPEARLHDAAMRVEHFIGPEVREELAQELNEPSVDPHGRRFPTEEARPNADRPGAAGP